MVNDNSFCGISSPLIKMNVTQVMILSVLLKLLPLYVVKDKAQGITVSSAYTFIPININLCGLIPLPVIIRIFR